MLYAPREYDLRIDWTVSVLAKLKGGGLEFLCEFDCTLILGFWDDGDLQGYDWEVVGICLDGPDPQYITKEIDPALWELTLRGVKADFEKIDERVQDRAAEIMADRVHYGRAAE